MCRMQGWVQDHSFLLLCLPCPPSYMTPERVAAIQSEIEGSDILRQRLRTALASRGRMPCLTVEFPLVAGADVRDVAGGMKALLDKLDHVMAVPRTDPVRRCGDQGGLAPPPRLPCSFCGCC